MMGARHRGVAFFMRAAVSILTLATVISPLPYATAADGRLGGNGIAAIMYSRYFLPSAFNIAGAFTLPSVRENASWYCIWILLIQRGKDTGSLPFIQGGLMREKKTGYKLAPFVAFRRIGDERLTYVSFPPFPDQSLSRARLINIRRYANDIVVSADGVSIYRMNIASLFTKGEMYAQLGSEVYAPGDRVSGTAASLSLQTTDDERPKALFPKEQFVNHGLFWSTDGETYFAKGRLDLTSPTCYAFRFDYDAGLCPSSTTATSGGGTPVPVSTP